MSQLLAALGCAGCTPQAPPPEQPTPSTVAAEPRHELGNGPVIVQGRLATGARGETPGSYLDIEVQGPGEDALAACDTLLAHERERLSHVASSLEVTVVRACSDAALAPPDTGQPFALMQSEELDEIALTLALGAPPAPGSKGRLHARRTRLSGFARQEACAAVLERIERASEEAGTTAEASAMTWLGEELEKQKKHEAESCKAGPGSAACERDQALSKMLEQKLAERPRAEPRESSSAASCFRR